MSRGSDNVVCVNSSDLWKNKHFLRTIAVISWIFCFGSNIVFYFMYAVSIPQFVTILGKQFQAELCQNHWRTNYEFMQPVAGALLQIHFWSVMLLESFTNTTPPPYSIPIRNFVPNTKQNLSGLSVLF